MEQRFQVKKQQNNLNTDYSVFSQTLQAVCRRERMREHNQLAESSTVREHCSSAEGANMERYKTKAMMTHTFS